MQDRFSGLIKLGDDSLPDEGEVKEQSHEVLVYSGGGDGGDA